MITTALSIIEGNNVTSTVIAGIVAGTGLLAALFRNKIFNTISSLTSYKINGRIKVKEEDEMNHKCIMENVFKDISDHQKELRDDQYKIRDEIYETKASLIEIQTDVKWLREKHNGYSAQDILKEILKNIQDINPNKK